MMPSETAYFAQMPPPGELDETYALSLILAYSIYYYRATLCCRRVSVCPFVHPSVCRKPALYQNS